MFRIKDYIDQKMSDPNLGPSEIAAAVNVSTRYLHKLFQAERRSVSQYVKERRLERSRRDLLDPRLAMPAPRAGRTRDTIGHRCHSGMKAAAQAPRSAGT